MKLSRYRVLFLAVSVLGVLYSCSNPTNPTTTGTLQVSSTPTGASVFLDGTDKGTVTNCSLTNVTSGNHTVKLVKSGYVDYQGTARVTAGQTTTFSATLTAVTAAALSVTPATGLTSTGAGGGPFTPSSQAYTLQNTGGAALDWTAAAAQAWVTVSPTAGNLAAGAMVTVTVSINAGANGLAAGAHNDTVTFTNTTNAAGNTTRPVSLTVTGAGALAVTPATGFTPNGNVGGPFTPSSQAYTLQNTGSAPIDWTAAATQAWVTVSPLAGNLAAGAMATVTVSINAGANSLVAGVYNDTVTFTNTTNADGNTTRPVSLSVTSGVTFISVTIDYSRVLPIPNPNGLDFPWVSWTYAGGNGTRGMAKVVDDVFTSPNVAIPTETVITIWVTDLKMDNGVTTRVCRTIMVNGQLIDVGATIYGEATFIIGANGIIRRP